jgi:nitrate reductase NapE component
MVKIAAGIAVVLLVVIIVFQMALAFGAPLGKAAWGGQHEGVLPTRLRIASAVAALLIYPLIVVAILGSAGFIEGEFLPGNGGQLMCAFASVEGCIYSVPPGDQAS